VSQSTGRRVVRAPVRLLLAVLVVVVVLWLLGVPR